MWDTGEGNAFFTTKHGVRHGRNKRFVHIPAGNGSNWILSFRLATTSFRFFVVEKGPVSKIMTRPRKDRNLSSEALGRNRMVHNPLLERLNAGFRSFSRYQVARFDVRHGSRKNRNDIPGVFGEESIRLSDRNSLQDSPGIFRMQLLPKAHKAQKIFAPACSRPC